MRQQVTEQHPATRAIRERIYAHEAGGFTQWWADEHSIDCDAEEFWAVVDEAVRASFAQGEQPRKEAEDVPG